MSVRLPVAVALIVHHAPLTPAERAGALQCLSILKAHPVVVVAPEGLRTPRFLRHLPAERFPDGSFRSVRDYNRLMLSAEFYARFEAYGHLLIHQLDAFVFRDELLAWCARGFDYVGAPWKGVRFPESPEWLEVLRDFIPPGNAAKWAGRMRVGNGGLSLRRVETLRRILRDHPEWLRAWGDRHEDAFWGIAARLCLSEAEYRIPTEEEALGFAFETRPEECHRLLGRLPFGCHAWDRMAPAFWRPWIREAGWRVHVPGDGGWQDRAAAVWRRWRGGHDCPAPESDRLRIGADRRSPFAGWGRRAAGLAGSALRGIRPAEIGEHVRYAARPAAYFRRREPRADVFYLFKENARRRALLAHLQEGTVPGLAGEQLFGLAELTRQGRSVDCNLRLPRVSSWAEGLRAGWDRLLAPRTGIGLGDECSVRAHLWQMNRARVVLATNDNVGLPAARLRERGRLRVPLVYVSIGLPERIQSVAERSPARAAAYRRFLARVDRFVAYGFAEARWLKTWLGPAVPVDFLPFGVDPDLWQPRSADDVQWDVLSIGTDPMRDFGLLRELARRRPALRIGLITGTERLAELGPLPGNIEVRLDVPLERVAAAIAGARMVVLPVKENTYSGATTTLLQCMAMGKAVAVSRVGAIREGYGFEDGVHLRWMEPGSADSLDGAVASILADDSERRRIGASARRHVAEHLAWNQYVQRLGNILAAYAPKEPVA